jgi:hypothetical protein
MDGELILRAFAMVAWQVGPSIDVAQTDIVPQPVQNPQLARQCHLHIKTSLLPPCCLQLRLLYYYL